MSLASCCICYAEVGITLHYPLQSCIYGNRTSVLDKAWHVMAQLLQPLHDSLCCVRTVQVMWAYASAKCVDRHMLHLAAERATALARLQAFSSSNQPTVLLRAFRALGMVSMKAMHSVNAALFAEVDRLNTQEAQQQQQ